VLATVSSRLGVAIPILVSLISIGVGPGARAQTPGEDTPANRPVFDVAVGMGVSFDNVGLSDHRTVAVPSFQVLAGAGEGLLGFEARLFSSAADGRYHQMANGVNDMAVDRLGVDAMLALRPLYPRHAEDHAWLGRTLRALTLEVGFGGESDSLSQKSGRRYGLVVGGHVDVPLTPATDPSELRLRLIARRLVADTRTVGTTPVSDTRGELFGALAFVF
jgi:hypothetical protein